MDGITCDEFEMVINSTYGRDHCTAFGKAILLGSDGVNYGLNKYCVWSSPSRLYMPHRSNWSLRTLGKENPKNFGNDDYLHFHQEGKKVLLWKSKVGSVCLTKFMIHARNNDNGVCNADLPKDVVFNFMNEGIPVGKVKHSYGYRWGEGKYPKDQEKTEWVRFTPEDGLFHMEMEEEERIGFILDEFSDLKINIESTGQELNVSKVFMSVNSSKKLEQLEEYTIPRTAVSINNILDEKVVLCLLLQKRIKIPEDCLFDYFLFFRHFGLKREMLHVLHQIPRIKHFRTLYDYFFKRIYGDEHEISKFEESVKKNKNSITELSFETSFAFSLFQLMKDRVENNPILLKLNPYIKSLEKFPWLKKNFRKCEDLPPSVLSHPDFENTELKDLEFPKVLEKLYGRINEEKDAGNMRLLSSDDQLFTCHKEVLSLRFRYFMTMFGSRWAERESLDRNEPIRIQGMSKEVMSAFHQYAYLGDIITFSDHPKMMVLVNLLLFSHMYISEDLKTFCLKKIDNFINEEEKGRKEEVEDERKNRLSRELNEIMDRLASQICDNECILDLIVPRLSLWTGIKEDRVYQKIHIYGERKNTKLEIEKLRNIIEEQQEVIQEMKKKNNEVMDKMLMLEKNFNLLMLEKKE